MNRFLPFLLLIAWPFSASAVTFLPERAASEPRYVAADSERPQVRAASNGNDFLVIWPGGAARVSAAGELLDIPSLLLPGFAAGDVIWTGSEYLIGWPQNETLERSSLGFVTISSEGVVLWNPLRIATEPITQPGRFRLARSGSVIAAAFNPASGGAMISIFTMSGAIVRTVRFDGSSIVELTADERGRFILLLDRSVIVLAADGSVISQTALPEGVRPLALAAHRNEILVVASHQANADVIRIVDGRVFSTAPLVQSPEQIYEAALESTGSEVLAVWTSGASISTFPPVTRVSVWIGRLSDSGQLMERRETTGFDSIARLKGPFPINIVSNGSTSLIAWNESTSGYGELGGRITAITVSGVLETRKLAVSTRATHQSLQAAADNGSNFLLLWSEPPSLIATRVSTKGEPLDGTGIVVTPSAQSGSAAFDGAATLVVWNNERGIEGRRVWPDGQVGSVFAVTTPTASRGTPALTCGGGTCLVAWNEFVDGRMHLRVARVRDGVVLDIGGLFVAENVQFALASDRNSFVVVMARDVVPAGSILSAMWIGATEPLSIAPKDFAASDSSVFEPRLVWDGTRYLATWREFGGSQRGSRLDRAGNSLDGEQTSWRGFAIRSPVPGELAMIGNQLASAHEDEVVLRSRDTLEVEQEIPLDVAAGPTKVFGRPDGSAIVAYGRWAVEPRYFNAHRVFFRVTGSTRPRTARRALVE